MTISSSKRTGDRKKVRPNINLGDSRESITIFPHRKNLKIKKTARRAVFCILIFESFAQKQRRKHKIR